MNKFKKVLATLLIVCFAVTLLPAMNVEAAKKPKLNKTSITITSEKAVQLKVLNSSKKWKWKSSNTKIAYVTSKGLVYYNNAGTCTITATNGKTKLKCKVTAKLCDTEKISIASQWLVEDMWNHGVCDLGWYYEYKTDACGEKMSPKTALATFNKKYKKVTTYNKWINGLKGSKYNKLKKKWNASMKKLKATHKTLNSIDWSKAPYTDGKFDYYKAWGNSFYDLYYYMLKFC